MLVDETICWEESWLEKGGGRGREIEDDAEGIGVIDLKFCANVIDGSIKLLIINDMIANKIILSDMEIFFFICKDHNYIFSMIFKEY